MCLAIPGKIVSIENRDGFQMAITDFGGLHREVCVSWVTAQEGDYILAHAGIALTIVDENEALITLEMFKKLEDAHR